MRGVLTLSVSQRESFAFADDHWNSILIFDSEIVLKSQPDLPYVVHECRLTPLKVKAFSLIIKLVGPLTAKWGKTDIFGFWGTRACVGPPMKSFCILFEWVVDSWVRYLNAER